MHHILKGCENTTESFFEFFDSEVNNGRIFYLPLWVTSPFLGQLGWLLMVKFRLGIFLLALCVWSYALGREYRSEIRLDFRLDNSVVDPEYGDNTQNLAQIADLVEHCYAFAVGSFFLGTLKALG